MNLQYTNLYSNLQCKIGQVFLDRLYTGYGNINKVINLIFVRLTVHVSQSVFRIREDPGYFQAMDPNPGG